MLASSAESGAANSSPLRVPRRPVSGAPPVKQSGLPFVRRQFVRRQFVCRWLQTDPPPQGPRDLKRALPETWCQVYEAARRTVSRPKGGEARAGLSMAPVEREAPLPIHRSCLLTRVAVAVWIDVSAAILGNGLHRLRSAGPGGNSFHLVVVGDGILRGVRVIGDSAVDGVTLK